MPTRRDFLKTSLAAGLTLPGAAAQRTSTDTLRLWAFSDAHVGSDRRYGNRESLVEAVQQSEFGTPDGAPPFEWDLAVDLGDQSGAQHLPGDDEGAEVVRQFTKGLREHKREDVYSVCGNHDRSGIDEPKNWWWRKWLDPMGEFTRFSGVDASKRTYPTSGTWERYSLQVGNVLFLMMSDINEPTQRPGRDLLGGNPGGVVSGETFAWWKNMVEANQDKIIVSTHHYMLKNTTVASGEWEGMRKGASGLWRSHYHGYKPLGTPRGASYLYWVDSMPDAQAFEKYLEAHPGAIDLWLGAHTHTYPDDTYGGKSHVETRWGVHFVNVSALARHHARLTTVPMSRYFTFAGNELRARCYLHTCDYAASGWYPKAERRLRLRKAFRW
ncbi:MAG: twin-arginine translocation signal domain-containing protein [Bryobacterales bacterium]|nr:twin-arginine translocation signal domain-containing protein [Bryobacterales bacterium]MDE0293752.1 twin-arginine translocation signal domain-containing protein [Bryobacterales bacterium]